MLSAKIAVKPPFRLSGADGSAPPNVGAPQGIATTELPLLTVKVVYCGIRITCMYLAAKYGNLVLQAKVIVLPTTVDTYANS